jgi:hypothetical protein
VPVDVAVHDPEARVLVSEAEDDVAVGQHGDGVAKHGVDLVPTVGVDRGGSR